MNELKNSKLDSLRARLSNSTLDAKKTAAIKGGALLEGDGTGGGTIYIKIEL